MYLSSKRCLPNVKCHHFATKYEKTFKNEADNTVVPILLTLRECSGYKLCLTDISFTPIRFVAPVRTGRRTSLKVLVNKLKTENELRLYSAFTQSA